MILSGMLAWGRTRVKETSRWPPLRWAFWLPAIAWMTLIVYLSQQTAPLGRSASTAESIGAHLVLYGALATLLAWALIGGLRMPARCPSWVLATVVFALAVLYGTSDEVHQAFVAGRTASEQDLGVDALGAALGIAIVLVVDRLWAARQRIVGDRQAP